MSIDIRDEIARDAMTAPPPGWIPADEWHELLEECIKERFRPLVAAKLIACWPGGAPCDVDRETGSIGTDVIVPTMDAADDSITLTDGSRCRATSDLRLAETSIVESFANQLELVAAALRRAAGGTTP